MGLQITPMSIGSGRTIVAQDLPLQKAEHVKQEEKKIDFKAFEATLPGDKTVADLQQVSLAFNRKLKFEVNHDSNEILIKVIDSETDKVIKVLPPEELQRLHSRIRETMGFLFDEKI